MLIAKMIRDNKALAILKNPNIELSVIDEFLHPVTVKVRSKKGPVTEITWDRWKEISKRYPGIFEIVQN